MRKRGTPHRPLHENNYKQMAISLRFIYWSLLRQKAFYLMERESAKISRSEYGNQKGGQAISGNIIKPSQII